MIRIGQEKIINRFNCLKGTEKEQQPVSDSFDSVFEARPKSQIN
jgi:hypothetical protein